MYICIRVNIENTSPPLLSLRMENKNRASFLRGRDAQPNGFSAF